MAVQRALHQLTDLLKHILLRGAGGKHLQDEGHGESHFCCCVTGRAGSPKHTLLRGTGGEGVSAFFSFGEGGAVVLKNGFLV